MGKANRSKNTKQQAYMKERNWFPWIITGISVITIIAVTILVITLNQTNQPGEQATSAPQGVQNDGYFITKTGLNTDLQTQPVKTQFEASEAPEGTNNLSLYIDYACTHCADFEEANFTQIEQWLQDGTLDSLQIHPVSFLTEYSTNGANAMACVAQNSPQDTLTAHKTLMENWDQGLRTTEILKALTDAGVNTTAELEKCVRGGTYNAFVTAATERASTGPLPGTDVTNVEGTPTVIFNGQRYGGDPADPASFDAFITGTGEVPATESPQIGTTTETE